MTGSMAEPPEERDRLNRLPFVIIGCAIRVHEEPGPGMKAGRRVEQQRTLAVIYRSRKINRAYPPDIDRGASLAVARVPETIQTEARCADQRQRQMAAGRCASGGQWFPRLASRPLQLRSTLCGLCASND